jgi:CBS domain-containing protein
VQFIFRQPRRGLPSTETGGMDMTTVAAILKHKGYQITAVGPTESVAHLAELMSARSIGSVLVLDSAGQLLGIVSERDIVRSLTANGGRTLEMTAGQLMTHAVQVGHPGTTVREAMTMMTVGRFRHLPVIDDGVLVGLISIGDVVKARIMEQESEVDSLRAYVSGAA